MCREFLKYLGKETFDFFFFTLASRNQKVQM